MQATEDYIVHLFEDTNLCAIHAKRVTISKDSCISASDASVASLPDPEILLRICGTCMPDDR